MTTPRWAGPLSKRSYFSQGIICCKQGGSLEDCPYLPIEESGEISLEGEQKKYRREAWLEGFEACSKSKMKDRPLYELNSD